MAYSDLWKYCTAKHCQTFLVSLDLFQPARFTEEKQIACLYALSNHPEQHYQSFALPKRNGTIRRLDAPDPLLKRVQTNLLHHFLEQQAISPYAAAYYKQASPAANARRHLGAPLLLKLDIKDFFPNITFPMVYQHAFSGSLLPPAAGVLLANLCCLRERLPQGAPTSPCLSNLVMKPFDNYIGAWCRDRGIQYSRYCDDMTFSGSFDAAQVIHKVSGFLTAMDFTLNREKTCVIPAGRRQTVTGVVVNEKAQVPRACRRAIRQEMFYCGKYGITAHLAARNGKPDTSSGTAGQTGHHHHADHMTETTGTDAAACLAYLHALLGRVQWVLSVDPDNQEFQTYRHQIRTWMRQSVN